MRRLGADDEEAGGAVGAVDEAVAVGVAGLPGGAVAGVERVFALVLEEGELALGDHDELVLGLVPVAERGAGAGFQRDQVGAELSEAGGVAEAEGGAAGHLRGIGLGVDRAGLEGAGGEVDAAHIKSPVLKRGSCEIWQMALVARGLRGFARSGKCLESDLETIWNLSPPDGDWPPEGCPARRDQPPLLVPSWLLSCRLSCLQSRLSPPTAPSAFRQSCLLSWRLSRLLVCVSATSAEDLDHAARRVAAGVTVEEHARVEATFSARRNNVASSRTVGNTPKSSGRET